MIRPVIILHEPQMGENIGAAARAMQNFGLSELRIVNPRDAWPNEKAIAMAVHAAPILEQAVLYDTLEEAIADRSFVLGTAGRSRDSRKPVYFNYHDLPEYKEHADIAIVFGCERTGLTQYELDLCNAIMRIPTDSANPSLNLAQAVVVVCYQLFLLREGREEGQPERRHATSAEIMGLVHHLTDRLEESGYYEGGVGKPRSIQNITNLFTKHQFTKQELDLLHGIVRHL